MNTCLTIAAPILAMRLQIAKACGIDTSLVLKRVGLNKATLLNPMARLTLAQDNAIWREIVALTGDRAIGLKLGQYIKLPGLGVVGYLLMNADTITEGMRRFCKYEGLLTNSYRSEVVQNQDSVAYITQKALGNQNAAIISILLCHRCDRWQQIWRSPPKES